MKRLLIVIIVLTAMPAWSQEFSASLGPVWKQFLKDEAAVAWHLSYLQKLGNYSALGITYLNEGHLSDHHRDGFAAQIWGRYPLQKLVLGAGVGPYFYLDTHDRFSNKLYSIGHGFGVIASLSADWHFRPPLFFQTRTNWIWVDGSFNTFSLLVGLGIDLETVPNQSEDNLKLSKNARNEISALIGYSIMNNLDSSGAFAWGGEYRLKLARHIELSMLYLNEGASPTIHREGIGAQLWAAEEFYDSRLTLAIGLGPYVARHQDRDTLTGRDGKIFAGLLSMSAAYRFDNNWSIRATWNRVITDYDRDADVIVIGPGFRF